MVQVFIAILVTYMPADCIDAFIELFTHKKNVKNSHTTKLLSEYSTRHILYFISESYILLSYKSDTKNRSIYSL